MLQLAFSGCAFERLHCVDLRCDCGNSISVDTDNFEDVKHDYVIIKKNITVTCSKCGHTYTPNDRYIRLEQEKPWIMCLHFALSYVTVPISCILLPLPRLRRQS